MFPTVRGIHAVELRQDRTTVLVLNLPFQAQFAIAIAKRFSQFLFQSAKTFDLFPDIHQLAIEHGLDLGTGMGLLPQTQEVLNFVQRKSQFLRMADERQVVNLLFIEQAISSCAATRAINES